MTKQVATSFAAALTILSASAALAQTAAPMHKPMKHAAAHKPAMMAAKSVYVCKDCKQYFTLMQAKKLGYKDPDGGKLVKSPNIPAGYTPGAVTKS